MENGSMTQEQGVRLRLVSERRSSQAMGKSVFADAIRSVDRGLADRVEATRVWRKDYVGLVRAVVEAGVGSAKNALRIADDGLESFHRNLEFQRDGDTFSLGGALQAFTRPRFATSCIKGRGTAGSGVEIPYRGERLRDDALRRRLDGWQRDGVVESSCAQAVHLVMDNPDWLDLSDLQMVVLGAGSEMGPLASLCRWNANVIAVDVPDPKVWQRIAATASEGTGRVFVPLREPSADEDDVIDCAGADLLTETPEVRTWLGGFEGRLVLGDYTYADGLRFVQLVGATDALCTHLASEREVSLAFLATPTDVFAVSMEVVTAARAAARRGGWRRAPLRAVTGGSLYRPNYGATLRDDRGVEWGISDCLIPQQGANYALAKNVQRWRALVAREEGSVACLNVAPASVTRSVVRNRILNAAFRGAPSFGVEIFRPETSRALMAALLVHDLRNPASAAQPSASLQHPYELFVRGAAHGGIWRLAHEPRSVLPLALAVGLAKR